MAADLNATSYSTIVTANSSMRAIAWNAKVNRGAVQKAVFKDFTGGEDSGLPVTKKQDLSKGQAEKVTFTNNAPIRGLGVLGENELRTATENLNFGTFDVYVDLLRQAISFSQKLHLVRFQKRSLDQLTSDLCLEWWARRNDDDIQTVLRRYAMIVAPTTNLMRVNNRATRDALISTDIISTTVVEQSKGRLIANGAEPLSVATGERGSEYPSYLFFGPDAFIRPIRQSGNYLTGLQQGALRGKDNAMFTGVYDRWDGNIFYPHNIMRDAANGRQGSPLMPIAFLGTQIADGTPTTITGGGTQYPAGTKDYFAYFPGFAWKTYDSETVPTDTETYYAMIYNLTGADAGKYEIIMYTTGDVSATAHQLATVTRGSTTQTGGVNGGGNVTAQAASRFTLAHPSGSIIIPCNFKGCLLGWAIHMGANALYQAVGSIGGNADGWEVQRIKQNEDFENDEGVSHLRGIGLQGVRGFGVMTDAISRAPNFVVVEGAMSYASFGVSPEAAT